MLIYTLDENIKDLLLNNGEVLIEKRELKNNTYYFFRLKNVSIMSNFSNEEKGKIFVVNNKMFL